MGVRLTGLTTVKSLMIPAALGRGGAAKYLIDGSEKRICRLSFEFYSPQDIERRSKTNSRPFWFFFIVHCNYFEPFRKFSRLVRFLTCSHVFPP